MNFVAGPTASILLSGLPASVTAGVASTVTVTLAATDTGSGVASTHYTTDGSTPTLASPTYTGPFPVAQTATSRIPVIGQAVPLDEAAEAHRALEEGGVFGKILLTARS